MTKLDQLPPMNFRLERVYALRQRCVPVHDETAELPPDPDIGFGWNWRMLGPAEFDVAISVQISPSVQRPDDIEAAVVGVFRYEGGEGSGLSFEEFVRGNAPAILMPYAREIISSLTSRSYHGIFYLPPVNVDIALKSLVEVGGWGDAQLEEEPELRASLGPLGPAAPKTLPAGNTS